MIDPFDLDRLVAKTAVELRTERARFRTLAGAREGAVTIPRAVGSKATLDELFELEARAATPLVGALIPWVRFFTVARVTGSERARLAESRFSEHGPLSGLVRTLLSPSVNLATVERTLSDAASGVRDALLRHEERVREASRLIGHPCDLDARGLAERTLELSEPLFSRDVGDRFSHRLRAALASDASEGWPVHLSHRWLASLFGRGELLRGLRLDDAPLPSPLGAASFARALGVLGEMLAFADRPQGTPFSLMRAPADELGRRRSALFGSLVLEPAFHQRKLGLGRAAAVEQTRRVARAAVTWLRTAALRVLAVELIAAPQGPRDFEELSERALGRALPRVLLGVVPALSNEPGRALVALADACTERQVLRERFDEDWFDNPRCHEALRHEHHSPREPGALQADDDGGVARSAALAARLHEALHE